MPEKYRKLERELMEANCRCYRTANRLAGELNSKGLNPLENLWFKRAQFNAFHTRLEEKTQEAKVLLEKDPVKTGWLSRDAGRYSISYKHNSTIRLNFSARDLDNYLIQDMSYCDGKLHILSSKNEVITSKSPFFNVLTISPDGNIETTQTLKVEIQRTDKSGKDFRQITYPNGLIAVDNKTKLGVIYGEQKLFEDNPSCKNHILVVDEESKKSNQSKPLAEIDEKLILRVMRRQHSGFSVSKYAYSAEGDEYEITPFSSEEGSIIIGRGKWLAPIPESEEEMQEFLSGQVQNADELANAFYGSTRRKLEVPLDVLQGLEIIIRRNQEERSR